MVVCVAATEFFFFSPNEFTLFSFMNKNTKLFFCLEIFNSTETIKLRGQAVCVTSAETISRLWLLKTYSCTPMTMHLFERRLLEFFL